MSSHFILFVFVVFAIVAVVVRLLAGNMDHQRIKDEVRTKGGDVSGIHWAPFGRGWFGERGDRIYEVDWTDAQARPRRSHVKTSALSGVYWTDASEAAENRRLRTELERRRR